MNAIYFEKATLAHKDIIFEWLEKPHVKEFWDNSPEHKEDIRIFIEGRKEPTPYHDGIFTYWIGSAENHPYCLVMTSEVIPTPNLPREWLPYLSQKGKTYSIDFMIGDEKYLGKRLAAPTLEAFTKFVNEKIDKMIDTFLIDPNENNPRAKHVYEKAGFHFVQTFLRKGELFYLMVKKINISAGKYHE